MKYDIPSMLIQWADQYETVKFIETDPIQIPHRYSAKRDIEISAFVTAWLAWGNRKAIIAAADYIDRVLFKGEPYQYIMRGDWASLETNWANLYRTYRHLDFARLCATLRSIYNTYPDMETWLRNMENITFYSILQCIRIVFSGIKGIPSSDTPSACKRLCMFLRWMVRKGPVDFGIWNIIDPNQLVIPLDTHVLRMSRTLQLFPTRPQGITATLTNAIALTATMRGIFAGDPCRADFALFGAGVENKEME